MTSEIKRATRPTIDRTEFTSQYASSSVMDRVRKWQEQVPVPSQNGDTSPTEEEVKSHIDESRSPGGASEKENTPGDRRSRHKIKVIDEEDQERARSGSAPRKRVVSDQHWRNKRSPPRAAVTTGMGKRTPVTPKSKLPDDGIRVKAIREPREKRRSSPDKKAESSQEKPRADADDGIRVYSTPSSRRSRHHSKTKEAEGRVRARSGSKDTEENEERRPSSEATLTPPDKDKTLDKRLNNSSRTSPRTSPASGSTKRRRSGGRKLSRPDNSPEISVRSPHGESRRSPDPRPSQSRVAMADVKKEDCPAKEADLRPAPLRIPGNRVEAWLSGTGDPFVERTEPTPSEKTAKKPRKKDEAEMLKPEQASGSATSPRSPEDELHRPRSSGSKRRREIRRSHLPDTVSISAETPIKEPLVKSPSPELVQSEPFEPEPSEPRSNSPLKRTGAKRHSNTILKPKARPTSRDLSSPKEDGVDSSVVSPPDPLEPSLMFQGPGGTLKRRFPPTQGRQLSTIASVDTLRSATTSSDKTIQGLPLPEDVPESEAGDGFNPNFMPSVAGSQAGLKRRLTTHADLMSVLSLPRGRNGSIRSARSIRTNRSRLATATIGDLMNELASDETKYMRELCTLVDGVIPVLLSCVLSKSESAVAAGLFNQHASPNDPNITRPIVDMGVALERLKSMHRRMPLRDPSALLTWAQGAQRVYVDYLKSWRMGFQDVVVNLAPASGEPSTVDGDTKSRSTSGEDGTGYRGLPMNEDGDIVNGDGERVDVAFLLKRPLVRLKYLAKTFKGLNHVRPSKEAGSMATRYHELVTDARRRSNEERARLEDEAAAAIDATRARDLHTLAPLEGVTIDPSRRVRARDYYDMELQHTSGQWIDCRVELLLRDDAPGKGSGGDLLICEVDDIGRWLLFPPASLSRVSARNGDLKGEIIVMVRGTLSDGQEWQELLSLTIDDEQAGFEWVQMLGLNPIPPVIMRTKSLVSRHGQQLSLKENDPTEAPLPANPRQHHSPPSPTEIDMPIGEQARVPSSAWRSKTPPDSNNRRSETQNHTFRTPPAKERAKLQKRQPGGSKSPTASEVSTETPKRLQKLPRSLNSPIEPGANGDNGETADSPSTSFNSSLKRAKAKRFSKETVPTLRSPLSSRFKDDGKRAHSSFDTTVRVEDDVTDAESSVSSSVFTSFSTTTRRVETDPILRPARKSEPSFDSRSGNHVEDDAFEGDGDFDNVVRPLFSRSVSSVPSMELPSLPRLRKSSQSISSFKETRPMSPEGSVSKPPSRTSASFELPPALRMKPTEERIEAEHVALEQEILEPPSPPPPPPPPHRSPSPQQKSKIHPPEILPPSSGGHIRRRSSSPLKHEYAPSSVSGSSASEFSQSDDESSSSESSEELENGDAPTPLLPLAALHRFGKTSPHGSIYSFPAGNTTLAPSQSASQAPYKTVPSQPAKASKAIASIFSWSDKGMWESLHPDECSVVITPGLIEAFEMTPAHSRPISSGRDVGTERGESSPQERGHSNSGEPPLVALELTPLVQLRRGTALDISIRSPPTANSRIKCGNNVMFRSRNAEECENLYAMINTSRINNPTYIALQNSRPSYSDGYSPSIARRNSTRSGSSSWWNLGRRGSYRASSSARTPSIAQTESSVGSFTSAFSALKRFSGGAMFNVSKSTVTSRNGDNINSRPNSVYSTSSGSSPIGTPIDPSNSNQGAIGMSNMKIRLYRRETASKWRDMGSSRLTILRPPTDGNLPGSPGFKQVLYRGNEKRIVINGKTKGECLLDVCLTDSCFERVARTGIAMSVWEESIGTKGEIGGVGAIGGVGGAKAHIYMIQFKSEAETAYVFSLVGKSKY